MRYQDRDTLLHRLNPLIKLAYSIVISISIVVFKEPYKLALLAAVVFAIFCFARVSFGQARPLFLITGIIVITTAVSQAVFYYFEPKTVLFTIMPKEFPVIGRITQGIHIYKEGIAYGLVQSLRIISVTFVGATIVATTHPSDMIISLNKIRLPREIGFMLMVSIRFLPQLLEETKRILLAVRLRGLKIKGVVNSIKAFRVVLLPLVINSLRQAKALALACEVRAFSMERSKTKVKFTTFEFITMAFFIILLYVAILPFKMGLSKIPFFNTFFFSIPFTCILFIGIRLIPKFGTATFLICGHSLFSQIISRGINPLWWPYALAESFALEGYFLLTKNYLKTPLAAIFSGAWRGMVVYLYFYFIAAPFIWHKCYATWYITIQTFQGVIGSGLGGILGYKISKMVEGAYKYGGL